MKKYLLPREGHFYKANLHCHSTLSDGRWTPEEIKENYKNHGYSVVAYTDHDVFVTHNELADEDFLPMNGYELAFAQQKKIEGKSSKVCHICFVSLKKDKKYQKIFYNCRFLEKTKTSLVLIPNVNL
jgi:histidinol phosphatase-like PHP family hydrolase